MTNKDTQAEQSPKNAGVGPAKADVEQLFHVLNTLLMSGKTIRSNDTDKPNFFHDVDNGKIVITGLHLE